MGRHPAGTTRTNLTREEFLADRLTFIGGSEIASVMGVGFGCPRRLVYNKLGTPSERNDDRMEFRRGRRLEGIAANYYAEETGREVYTTTKMSFPGRPHLSVNMDRIIFRKEDEAQADPGYLELKVVGRFSWFKILKEGLIEDYILQVQYGCAVTGFSWGAYGIYCPDMDGLLHWDIKADKELGAHLIEAADDLWNLNVQLKILPEPLPEFGKVCANCEYLARCRGQAAPTDTVFERPDLEDLAGKLREVRGMGKEAEEAADGIREEILAAIGRKPGAYRFGKYPATVISSTTKKFSAEILKKEAPEMYEKCKKTSVVETVKIGEEQ